MRKSILGALTGALLAAGCGGSTDLGEGLGECKEPGLNEMSLALPLDGLELRAVCSVGTDPSMGRADHTYGTSCSSSTCQDEVTASDAGTLGWRIAEQITCDYHLIGMKDGKLVINATSDGDLPKIFGSVDNVAEAEVVATLHHLGCQRIGQRDGALYVLGRDMIASCPVQMQDVLYRIDSDGTVQEAERGDITQDGSCVGRRPAGLSPRRDSADHDDIGDFLARSAELEAASVVAFQILEAELAAHGAPRELLERARAAAADEVRHARMMQRLAERFGAEPSPRSIRVGTPRDLESIATENAIEGCVVETWGCVIGMHQARHAQRGLDQAYRRIAADEARHAQLSWDIAAWAESQLIPEAVARVGAARARAVAELKARVAQAREGSDAERTLGLPDGAARLRLFTQLQATLWS